METRESALFDRRSLLRRGGVAAVGVVGTTGLATAAAKPAFAVGVAFNPIDPYRSYDSRNDPSGPLLLHQIIDLDVWTDENGTGKIPNTAAAVTYNLTITQTRAAGNLAMFPAGVAAPGVSSINWVVSNLDLANGGTVRLGTSGTSGPGSVSIVCDGAVGAQTHLIVDITGYYI